jgi:hypothetical protein
VFFDLSQDGVERGTRSVSRMVLRANRELIGGALCDAPHSATAGHRGYIDKGGVFTSFDPPGSASTTINGVNDQDDIVDFFTSPSDAVIGFVGTPVPEPSGWAMMLVGAAGLGSLGYRTVAQERPSFSIIDHNEQARKLLISSSVSPACNSTVPASTEIKGNPWDDRGADSALVPASPSIETTAA